MTFLNPPDHPRVASRVVLWSVIVLCAGATGLFWAGQRQERTVDATVRLSLVGELDTAGTLHVIEELIVQTAGRETVQRILAVPAGLRWAGVTDATGQPVDHTTLPLAEGLQVTVPFDAEPSVVQLHYDLIGIAHAGMDAAELVWPIVDDRNPLAISGLEVDIAWAAGAEPEVVDVEAPGAATTVVGRAGGLRVQSGALPAHHLVQVHAAIPREAVTDGMVEQRSVLADMAAPTDRRAEAGGGPAWPPVAASLVFLTAWGIVHRSHGREPDAGPPTSVDAPPSSHSPAEVAWLLRRGTVRKEDLVATIVDLAEHGVLTADGATWTLLARAAGGADLRPHERVVVDWLFPGKTVLQLGDRLQEIRHTPSDWRDMRRGFTTAVQEAGRASGLVERTVDAESILGGGVAATSMVVLGVVGTALGQAAWLLCVAVGALAIVAVDTFARRSREGADMAARWQSFGAHLRWQPSAVAGHRGLALTLGVAAAATPAVVDIATAIDQFEETYVASTSYLSKPARRRLGPRREGVRT